MSFTAEELMRIGDKHRKRTQYPYAIKTKYGKQMSQVYVPNLSLKPTLAPSLNNQPNYYRPSVRKLT